MRSFLSAFAIELKETRFEHVNERIVQPIQPDHRTLAFMFVIVPVPIRSQEQVTRMHVNALSVNNSIGAVSFDNEAKCGSSMSMCLSSFARKDDLNTSIEGIDCGRRLLQTWINKHKNTSLSFVQR